MYENQQIYQQDEPHPYVGKHSQPIVKISATSSRKRSVNNSSKSSVISRNANIVPLTNKNDRYIARTIEKIHNLPQLPESVQNVLERENLFSSKEQRPMLSLKKPSQLINVPSEQAYFSRSDKMQMPIENRAASARKLLDSYRAYTVETTDSIFDNTRSMSVRDLTSSRELTNRKRPAQVYHPDGDWNQVQQSQMRFTLTKHNTLMKFLKDNMHRSTKSISPIKVIEEKSDNAKQLNKYQSAAQSRNQHY